MSVIVFADPAVAIELPSDRASATHVDRLHIFSFIFSTSLLNIIIERNNRAGFLLCTCNEQSMAFHYRPFKDRTLQGCMVRVMGAPETGNRGSYDFE